MTSNTPTAKWDHTKAATEVGKEYPDIYTSIDDWIEFHTDFMMLIRVCVSERVEGSAGLDKREILERPTTKKYDAKAQANGKPTLLARATQQANKISHADLDRELKGALASLAEDRDQLAAEMMSGETAETIVKLMQKDMEKDH